MEITIPYYEDYGRISRSSMNLFKESPAKLKKYLDGENEFKSSKAMENGTTVHSFLLEKDKFKQEYVTLDFEIPSSQQQKQFALDYIASKEKKPILKASEAFKNNYSTTGQSDKNIATKGLEMALKLKQYIKFLRLQESAVKKPITWAKLNTLKQIECNIKLHKKANWLLYKSSDDPEWITESELHINWDIAVGERTIQLKSLIDRFMVNHEKKHVILCDVKTTVSVSKFKDSFDTYDYGGQLSFYWMAIYWYFKNVLKKDISEYTHETLIVAIDNIDSSIKVFDIPDLILTGKISEIEQTLSEINWHLESGLWEFTRSYYEGDGAEPLPLI